MKRIADLATDQIRNMHNSWHSLARMLAQLHWALAELLAAGVRTRANAFAATRARRRARAQTRTRAHVHAPRAELLGPPRATVRTHSYEQVHACELGSSPLAHTGVQVHALRAELLAACSRRRAGACIAS